MKKLIIATIVCISSFTAIGQIKVTATISKVTRYSVECIYTTITNNSNDSIYILDGGWYEPKDNSFNEYSHLGAYFTGFSNEMKPIFERNNYPLSLPYGDRIPKIKIHVGESYTTYTRLYGNHDFYGIIDDQSIAPNIIYLSANIKMICSYKNGEFNYLTIPTNKIKLK